MKYIGINTPDQTVGINLDNIVLIKYDKAKKTTEFYSSSTSTFELLDEDRSIYNYVARIINIGKVGE